MNTNLQELRREAYRLWGIKPRHVIYNMPMLNQHNFVFQIDYADKFKDWPKAYVVYVPNFGSVDRAIVPIKVIKKFGSVISSVSAWYDMPLELNRKLVDIVKGLPQQKKLPLWKRVWNKLLPSRCSFNETIAIEDYIYRVSLNGENVFDVILEQP